MTGYELLEALTKMPKEALRKQIYCGGSDDEEIVEVFKDRDGAITMYTAQDRAEFDEMVMDEAEREEMKKERQRRDTEFRYQMHRWV